MFRESFKGNLFTLVKNLKEIFYKFEFDEASFSLQKRKLSRFLSGVKRSSAAITFLKLFPPCILDPAEFPMGSRECIKVGPRHLIITNNLYFGSEFKDINSLFVKSRYVSKKCHGCRFYQSSLCRGLLNQSFVKNRNALIKKLGSDEYNAIKSDYENGLFVYGSPCSKKCLFCFDKYVPKEILRVVPFLSPLEILHFIHYIPREFHYVGNTYHCRSGEIMDSPYFFDIMCLLLHFSGNIFINTSGRSIDNKIVNLLKNKVITFCFSINTLSKKWSKQLMREEAPVDYVRMINRLRKNNISYRVSLIPFKSLVTSKDIFSTMILIALLKYKCHRPAYF